MTVPHYKCPGCVHKVSRNVLRGSRGVCPHCRTKMPNKDWMAGSRDATLLIGLSKVEKKDLQDIADQVGFDLEDLLAAAIRQRLRAWRSGEDIEKAVRADLMLEKLYGN